MTPEQRAELAAALDGDGVKHFDMPADQKVFSANVRIVLYAKNETEAYDKIDRLLSASDDVQHAHVKAICEA